MPLTLIETPPAFCSAYKPLSIVVTSTKHPNNTAPGESGIAILTIKVADASDVATHGAPLAIGDLFIWHSTVSIGVLPIGQTVKVSGSDISAYDGVWRVLKEVGTKVTVIACDNFGTAIMGTVEKYYENYTLVASLSTQAVNGTKHYDVSPNSAGQFEFDPSDRIRATFKDVFDIADTTAATVPVDAEKYITQQYEVLFEEAYNIPDVNGVNVYTELHKKGATLLAKDLVAVNSVQPYVHLDETDGDPDLLWEDDLDDYAITGATPYRWLTHRHHGSTYNTRTAQRCAHSDACWLAFLYMGTSATYRIRRHFINAAGATTTTYEDVVIDKDSYLLNAGAEALGLPTNVVRYSVALYSDTTEVLPETWFTIEEPCYDVARFYVFNRFGGIDNYTADGSRMSRGIDVKRKTVGKSSMARTLTVAGDYQRRTYATEPLAIYEQTTRKEGKETARWIVDELLSSPDVRIQQYDGDTPAYTRVIFGTDKADAGVRAERFDLTWTLGTDNQRQRR